MSPCMSCAALCLMILAPALNEIYAVSRGSEGEEVYVCSQYKPATNGTGFRLKPF